MKSQIIYSKSLPAMSAFPTDTLLFYDSVLLKNKFFKSWLKPFKYKIPLKSGEQLKTLESLNLVLNKISKLEIAKSTELTFVGIGGGTIGDFTGFLASVFLRGRNLVLIPSTWLSAVDSAHGGKNGLNFLKVKNQIGSFYPAHKIYICEELLLTQPPQRLTDSLGEIIKIAVLGSKKLFNDLEENRNSSIVLKRLPEIINLKNKIVRLDPFEKKGTRRLLNLGHTMGHVFESRYGWAHGLSVLLGLQFSARWSFHSGLLNAGDFFKISMLIDLLELDQDLNTALKNININKTISLLAKDKKLTSAARLDFVFIYSIGNCHRKSVKIDQIINEIERQKLVY